MPKTDSDDLEDRTFVISTKQSRAVTQFLESDFSIGGRQCSEGHRDLRSACSKAAVATSLVTLAGLIASADAMLYQAKSAGRNQVKALQLP